VSELNNASVPHLTTALKGPLEKLERDFIEKQVQIESWFREQWRDTKPPIYCSADLRNSGFKLAPVDTNLFPAGFNNLNLDFLPLCIQAMETAVDKILPGTESVLLIPENHTRNVGYFENLAILQEILAKAGFVVRVGSLLDSIKSPREINLPSGRKITLMPLIKENGMLGVKDFFPKLIILNHDMSDGVPEQLKDSKQTILPALNMSWAYRLKSDHFKHYADVTDDFSKIVGIDPWLITPRHRNCSEVDFVTRGGEDCLVGYAETLFKLIQKKYDEYDIKQSPFLVLKADAGTYGMAVMTIQDPGEIRNLNRKQRTKMSMTKGGIKVKNVILQEGVYTFETVGDEGDVAEPVVYMIGHHVVGGFYRVHMDKGPDENLNAPGMRFHPLAFENACNNPKICPEFDEVINRFYAYGVVGRLALLAASREMDVRP